MNASGTPAGLPQASQCIACRRSSCSMPVVVGWHAGYSSASLDGVRVASIIALR